MEIVQDLHSSGDTTPFCPVGLFHGAVFLTAFVLVTLRRPDAVLNAQFFAEDGVRWYSDAYNLGLRSLLMPESGYLHTLTRLIALMALLVPFSFAPLVMNLCAIAVQILPVNVWLSERFGSIPMKLRLFGSFIYLGLPNTYEIDANITTIQWHLALLAALLLLSEPSTSKRWRFMDVVVLVLISIDGPMGMVLIPFAAVVWRKRRHFWSALSLVLLIPGSVLQAIIVLVSHSRPPVENGASIDRLITILGRQIFLSSLIGMKTVYQLLSSRFLVCAEIAATALGVVVLVYALLTTTFELKMFILFAFSVLTLSLAHPLATRPDGQQWQALCIPGCGSRYYFFPTLAFQASILWTASNRRVNHQLRYTALCLLLLLPLGVYADWQYPPFVDFGFRSYAAAFDRAKPGTEMTIPINPPGWSMRLRKH